MTQIVWDSANALLGQGSQREREEGASSLETAHFTASAFTLIADDLSEPVLADLH
jgi:hypothetical protein